MKKKAAAKNNTNSSALRDSLPFKQEADKKNKENRDKINKYQI